MWPKQASAGHGFAELINRLPKHVASRTLSGPLDWNAQLIDGDLAGTVAELKRASWGEGLRPLAGDRPPIRLRLIVATTFSCGVVLVSYQPTPAAVAAG